MLNKIIFICALVLCFIYSHYSDVKEQKIKEEKIKIEKQAKEKYLNSPEGQDETARKKSYDGSVVVSQTGKKYYRGMLCSQDCSGHIKGYEWAIELGVTNYDACNSNSASFTEGCERGVDETYENLTSYCHDEVCDDYCAENYVDDYDIDREYYGRFRI